MRRLSLVSFTASLALLFAPALANAATQVGQTVDPTSSNCSPNDTFLQAESPHDQFAIPFDGVITSWSFRGGNVVPTPLKLKVGTVGATTMTVTGESAFGSPAPGQLNTFSTRIPTRSGNVIGFYFPAPGDLAECAAHNRPGYMDFVAVGDVVPGSSSPITGEPGQLDVSANLEPDCDKDGLGDQTQDSDISSCPPCGGQKATIVGTPGKDVLSGSTGRDVIVGLGGKDRLSGLGGKDLICGGPGKDTLKGGGGNDKLFGNGGRDILKGGKGKDKLVGGPGKDKQIQ